MSVFAPRLSYFRFSGFICCPLGVLATLLNISQTVRWRKFTVVDDFCVLLSLPDCFTILICHFVWRKLAKDVLNEIRSRFSFVFLLASIPPVIQSSTDKVESYEEDLYLAVEIGTRLEVIQGAKLDLICRVTGFPTPNVNWVKGNSPLTASFERQGFFIVPYNGTSTTLLIRGSQPPQEDEVYGCTAYNSGGSVTAFSYVTFKGEFVKSTTPLH